jgi:glycine cleavage system H lipoate-binding protein
VEQRTCPNAFDCRRCGEYPNFASLPAAGTAPDLGLSIPKDRFYHRGHTWVRPEEDGTVTIGLDALAQRMIGDPDWIELPQEGAALEANGIAWRMKKHGREIRVRAPIDGTVVDHGRHQEGWYLKLRPAGTPNFRHLLREAEVPLWMSRELERLQLQLRQPGAAPSLADGGVLMSGLMEAMPEADWDAVLAATFLEV